MEERGKIVQGERRQKIAICRATKDVLKNSDFPAKFKDKKKKAHRK